MLERIVCREKRQSKKMKLHPQQVALEPVHDENEGSNSCSSSDELVSDTSLYLNGDCRHNRIPSLSVESITSHSLTILVNQVPGPMDIIMGRGRRSKFSRPGPARFHNLLLKYYDKYNNAICKSEKKSISNHVLSQMKEIGCRFLKQTTKTSGLYVECDDATAREKICHGFRNIRMAGRNSTDKSRADKKGCFQHRQGPPRPERQGSSSFSSQLNDHYPMLSSEQDPFGMHFCNM